MEMVPVFWDWLLHMAELGHVKMSSYGRCLDNRFGSH
ncbi:hypothetical protein [Burkholderia cenocepacia]